MSYFEQFFFQKSVQRKFLPSLEMQMSWLGGGWGVQGSKPTIVGPD